jgi:flagellar M-ring protein FliF
MAGFNEGIGQARQFWATRSARQKGLLLAGAAATVLLVALFAGLIGSPDYKPLFTGLESADAQALAAQLDAEGIPHQASADGKTISVPSSKLAAARMKTASKGAPGSGRMGFELFDKMSWGQTEFDQKVTYQRALEGELERTIETIGDVESARVHLVMPTDSVFLDKQQPAKASVILKLRGNGLNKGAVLAISRLVSGAVKELSPEDVSIIDADSARSLGSSHDGQDDGEGIESTLTQRLISTLEPVVGTDRIRASVNIDHSPGSTEESREQYDPSVTALLSDQKTEESAGGSAVPAGVAGTTSNTPQSKTGKPPASSSSSDSQSSKSETAQYGVNKVVLHTVLPAGRIERVSAAILVDDAVVRTEQGGKSIIKRRKWSQEELNKFQEIAEKVIGFDAKRGDTITIQNMSFDSNAAGSDVPAPTWIEKGGRAVSDYSSLLRPASLLVLFLLAYLFVLRPIQKQAFAPGLPQLSAQPALAAGAGADRLSKGSAEMGESTQSAAQLKNQTVELIKQKPVNSTRAVQAWLREEPS